MKRVLIVAAIALLCAGFIRSKQQPPYRVVFDLTSRDTLDQKALMRWVGEISKSDPKAEIEVVMYGKGWEIVLPDRSKFNTEVQEALKNPHVAFNVCEGSLRNNNLQKSQLANGVGTVPDGIRELVTKQQENWGYIKVVH
jgi:uncharacterized protein